MLDFQWFMYYDSNVLKPTDNTNKSTSFEYPSQGSLHLFNKKIPGEIGATGTNLMYSIFITQLQRKSYLLQLSLK